MTNQGYAESDVRPPDTQKSRGKIFYNYDISEVEREVEGEVRTVFQYKYRQYEKDADIEVVAKINSGLSELGALEFDDINAHIDSVFGGLSAGQKLSLKKLYKAVLALIKLREIEKP